MNAMELIEKKKPDITPTVQEVSPMKWCHFDRPFLIS